MLLGFSSLVIMHRFRRQRSPSLFWYFLALVAIAMLAVFLQTAMGSSIGWVGRSSCLVAAYFLISVVLGWKEARERGFGLEPAAAELFGPGLLQFNSGENFPG